MSQKKSLPPITQASLNLLKKKLPSAIESLIWENQSRIRALKSDYRRHLQEVLSCLVKHYDLATGLLIRCINFNKKIFIPVTLEYIAKECHCCTKTVTRIFRLLHRIGIIRVKPQRKTHSGDIVGDSALDIYHACSRYLTERFFDLCGLRSLFITSLSKANLLTNITIRECLRRKITPKRAPSPPQEITPPPRQPSPLPPNMVRLRPVLATGPEMSPEERLKRTQALGIHIDSYLLELARNK